MAILFNAHVQYAYPTLHGQHDLDLLPAFKIKEYLMGLAKIPKKCLVLANITGEIGFDMFYSKAQNIPLPADCNKDYIIHSGKEEGKEVGE